MKKKHSIREKDRWIYKYLVLKNNHNLIIQKENIFTFLKYSYFKIGAQNTSSWNIRRNAVLKMIYLSSDLYLYFSLDTIDFFI